MRRATAREIEEGFVPSAIVQNLRFNKLRTACCTVRVAYLSVPVLEDEIRVVRWMFSGQVVWNSGLPPQVTSRMPM